MSALNRAALRISLCHRHLSRLMSQSAIEDYICVGRARVLGTELDPYRTLTGHALHMKIVEDAKALYSWYKQFSRSDSATQAAHDFLVNLQHGPFQNYFPKIVIKSKPAKKRGRR